MVSTQKKIDFPVRKTRSLARNDLLKSKPLKNRSSSAKNDENYLSSPSKKSRKNIDTCKKILLEDEAFLVYQKAKHLLNTACPDRILGREKEIQQMSLFLDEHLCKKKAGSLYISGPPGTGKTACLTHLLKALENSRLVLVGVANALDLTDRILPRLKACGIFPHLCNFGPYSKDQIQAIIQDRLKEVTYRGQDIFKPIAIQFCARKVSACAGDIRKALDICRRAIELVEADIRRPALKSTHNEDICRRAIELVEADIRRPALKSTHNEGSVKNSPKKFSEPFIEFKPVDLSQVSSVLRSIYDSRIINSNQSFSQTFPLQQKVVIGTLLLMATKGKDKEVTIGKVHEVYCRVCKKRQISEISQSEFDSLCNLIESRGIVAIKAHKEKRLSKYVSKLCTLAKYSYLHRPVISPKT
ncbi:Cell division control protein 6 [Nymphon striatum]|nr:Cell division control protein 6 [Nymphon striatum]